MAAPRSSWGLVQPRVSQWAHTIAYDRAGLGRSDSDTQPRSVGRMADDLEDLLGTFGHGPFVLVATSGGALVVREYALRRPAGIAGLVLVDPTDERVDAVFTPSFRRFERIAHHVSVALAGLGLLERLYNNFLVTLPADSQDEFRREGFTMRAMRTRAAELKGMVAAMNDLRRRPDSMTDMPTTVISGALADMGMSHQLRAQANAAHSHRASLSMSGRYVVAERSGHMIPFTEPEVIIEEIRRMVGLLIPRSIA